MKSDLENCPIDSMVVDNSDYRISAKNVLHHPYFWDANHTMDFFREVKDIVGDSSHDDYEPIVTIFECLEPHWHKRLPPVIQEYLTTEDTNKKRVYKSGIKELIFCIRNTFEHITQMPMTRVVHLHTLFLLN